MPASGVSVVTKMCSSTYDLSDCHIVKLGQRIAEVLDPFTITNCFDKGRSVVRSLKWALSYQHDSIGAVLSVRRTEDRESMNVYLGGSVLYQYTS